MLSWWLQGFDRTTERLVQETHLPRLTVAAIGMHVARRTPGFNPGGERVNPRLSWLHAVGRTRVAGSR